MLFTIVFTIYGLPGYNSIFPSELRLKEGGGGVSGLTHRSEKVYYGVMIKNCNDMDIQVGCNQ